jgi:hypothetical protein
MTRSQARSAVLRTFDRISKICAALLILTSALPAQEERHVGTVSQYTLFDIPQASSDARLILELSLRPSGTFSAGAGALVRLRDPRSREGVEIRRLSLYPLPTASENEVTNYRFDITEIFNRLRSAQTLVVEVWPINRMTGAPIGDASITIRDAHIIAR